ncbi:MAG TPA: BatA domain-containing protein, partial [Planctomycetota bacterium]|nr:BatA domain-containing protein [Planctomycetota bacterium]
MNIAFGSAAMLAGAALVGVPILIHLLNRRRFVIVPFAAMRFLQAAFARRRRRLRMESLLLLLLRCLIVLLAALAMALPFVPDDSPLALVSGGRRELVCIVDRSGSMGRQVAPGTSADDRVLESLRRRLGKLSDARGDAVTLLSMGSGPALLAPIGAPPSVALAALDNPLPPPGGVADLVAAARLLKDRVRPERPGRLDVLVLTDLQRLTWLGAGQALGGLFAGVFEQGGGTLRIVPAVAEEQQPVNLGVQSLVTESPLMRAREPITFTATVHNWSQTSRATVEGSFLLDGVQVDRQRLELAPQGDASASVRRRIDAPGAHHMVFSLDTDDLPFDDSRAFAFDVRDTLTVLLVDGSPGGSDELSSGTGYLRLALDPGDEEHAPARFEPVVFDTGRFEESAAELPHADAIVLANVGGLSAAAAAALAQAVSSGTPLLYFLGDNVLPALYEERLAPLGLLPVRLPDVPVRGDPGGRGGEDYVTLALPEPPPAALALFADPRLSVLLQVPVFAWREMEALPDSHVLASFADATGRTTPAIVEGRLQRGRILVVGTSADARWSLLPRNPALWVPLVHELLTALVAADPGAANVPVGQTPTLVVDGFPLAAQLTDPSGAVTLLERPASERLGSRAVLRLDSTPFDEAGPWKLEVTTSGGPGGNKQVLALAALPDAREGSAASASTCLLPP